MWQSRFGANRITMNTIQHDSNRIPLHTLGGVYFVKPEDIVRLEASSNYTNIFFTNKTRILTSRVLKEFALLLEPMGFIRTHRSHLVNRQHILFVDSHGNITMQDLSKAEISRRKKMSIMKALKH
jgi:two-component system, LytTR family, response regulator